MSEEQLERSILERKASDELRAIATAMSLEPVARLRKADLVNQILRAAGVEVEGTLPLHASGAASLQSPLIQRRRRGQGPGSRRRGRLRVQAGARPHLEGPNGQDALGRLDARPR